MKAMPRENIAFAARYLCKQLMSIHPSVWQPGFFSLSLLLSLNFYLPSTTEQTPVSFQCILHVDRYPGAFGFPHISPDLAPFLESFATTIAVGLVCHTGTVRQICDSPLHLEIPSKVGERLIPYWITGFQPILLRYIHDSALYSENDYSSILILLFL